MKIEMTILSCPDKDYWKYDIGIPVYYDSKRNLVETTSKYFPDIEFCRHTANLAKFIRAVGKIVKIWKDVK